MSSNASKTRPVLAAADEVERHEVQQRGARLLDVEGVGRRRRVGQRRTAARLQQHTQQQVPLYGEKRQATGAVIKYPFSQLPHDSCIKHIG